MNEKIISFPEKNKKDPDQEELDEALARLKKSFDNRDVSTQPKNIETESDFKANLFSYEGNIKNLYLDENGLSSIFSLDDSGITFMELRGPDGEHVTNSDIVARHISEAERLLSNGLLSAED